MIPGKRAATAAGPGRYRCTSLPGLCLCIGLTQAGHQQGSLHRRGFPLGGGWGGGGRHSQRVPTMGPRLQLTLGRKYDRRHRASGILSWLLTYPWSKLPPTPSPLAPLYHGLEVTRSIAATRRRRHRPEHKNDPRSLPPQRFLPPPPRPLSSEALLDPSSCRGRGKTR